MAQKGLSEAMVALRLGFWVINHRPGLLFLFVIPQFILWAVTFGLTRGAGVPRDSLTYSTAFIITALLTYIPVTAAAVLEAEAAGSGRVLPHREALRQGLRNLRFVLIPFLIAWFGAEAIGHLLLLPIPAVALLVSQNLDDVVAFLGVAGPTVTVIQVVLIVYLASRLLIALPDRVLSEEDPPKLWPALLVFALVGTRSVIAGASEGVAQLSTEELGSLGVAGAAPTAVMISVAVALVAILLLSLWGRIPAGLRWSWRASRDLDLFVACLTLVVVLALSMPRTWVFLATLAGGGGATLVGILLYFLALLLLAGVFGHWGLGFILTGVMGLLFLTQFFVPVNLFIIGSIWVVPLALLVATSVSLYFRVTEAAE